MRTRAWSPTALALLAFSACGERGPSRTVASGGVSGSGGAPAPAGTDSGGATTGGTAASTGGSGAQAGSANTAGGVSGSSSATGSGGASGSASGGAGASSTGGGNAAGAGGATGPECEGEGDTFAWPAGAKAAVTLTYDDGLPSQLSNAVPGLDDHGFPATLFLSESFQGFEQRKAAYQELVARGFELAGHTVKHPCFGLSPDLATYGADALAAELDQNIATLRDLGMKGPLTFAYPCGNTEYGEPRVSYRSLIEARFGAARGVNCCAELPGALDLFDVNANWPSEQATSADVTTPVDQALQSGSWLVFGFHAVGDAPGEWSTVPQAAHDALLAHLDAHRGELWIGTFGAVADYVSRCR